MVKTGKGATKRKPGRPWPAADRTSKAGRMTAKAFSTWLQAMGYTDSDAARKLGTSPSTIGNYRTNGAPAAVALACSAIAKGLDGWKP